MAPPVPSGQMSDDPEVLRKLLRANLAARRAAQQAGDEAEAMRLMEEGEKLDLRLQQLGGSQDTPGGTTESRFDPGWRPPSLEEKKPYDEPMKGYTDPDLAVEGQREDLDLSDPRVQRSRQRMRSEMMGRDEATRDIAEARVRGAQQRRSPTAEHGGRAGMDARFGPGSPLGATPHEPKWNRPTQTDPDADPTGIVPGDRPIRFQQPNKVTGKPETDPTRFERRAPGQGIWTGDIRRPDYEERAQAAIAKGYLDVAGKGRVPLEGRNLAEVVDILRDQDQQQGTRVRGAKARLREKHALAARARSIGLGYKPPPMFEQGGDAPTRGSKAHLTQAKRQQQQQRTFLRSARQRPQQGVGGMPGFDVGLYNKLKQTNPSAAAKMLNDYQKNRADLARERGLSQDRAASRDIAERNAASGEARVELIREDQNRTNEIAQSEVDRQKPVKRKEDFRIYQDTEPYPDPYQASIEEGGDTLAPNAGVNTPNPDHWIRVVALKDADETTQEGKWDRAAYAYLKQVFDDGSFKRLLQDNGAEQYADYIIANRAGKGLPGWMTRSHIIMAYGHFGTGAAEYNPGNFAATWYNPASWFDEADSPEDWDYHIK